MDSLDQIVAEYKQENPRPKSWVKGILLILFIPFYARLVIYNVVYDFPLGWLLLSIISILSLIVWGKSSDLGWKVCWYQNYGILAKYLMVFIFPIFLTAMLEDFKLSRYAILHNSTLQGQFPVEDEETTDIIYNSLMVVNKVGGDMIYLMQLPFLGFFTKIDAIKVYQQCLVKKFEGKYSETPKEKIYEYFFVSFMKMSDIPRLESVNQVIQYTYPLRMRITFKHAFRKVLKWEHFDECR